MLALLFCVVFGNFCSANTEFGTKTEDDIKKITFLTLTEEQSQEVWKNRERAPTSLEKNIIGIFSGVRIVAWSDTNLRMLLYDLNLCIKEIWFPNIEDGTKYFATIQLNASYWRSCSDWSQPVRILIVQHFLVRKSRRNEICTTCNGAICRKMKSHLKTAALYFERERESRIRQRTKEEG